jgi:hypothetical protein
MRIKFSMIIHTEIPPSLSYVQLYNTISIVNKHICGKPLNRAFAHGDILSKIGGKIKIKVYNKRQIDR